MSQYRVGQRYVSEPEPELGLGIVTEVESYRIAVAFPGTGENRLYAPDTPILKRVMFREGERVSTRDGDSFVVVSVLEKEGIVSYTGDGIRVSENELSDVTSFSNPHERLMSGQVDSSEAFDLRMDALRGLNKMRQSEARGFLGGRVDLIPHQYYILQEVSSRQIPRVLLADEVGLGKTIEACLIMQRLRAVGRANRVLIIVPESLVHQWFVELLRRFNMWFSIFDEPRCQATEKGIEGGNPFLGEQLVLTSVDFLSNSEIRGGQSIEAEWDLVIVDEAHHLEWTPGNPSDEYTLVEALGQRSPGLLLLTATPTQLGVEGHFARLRLLDPDRYGDLEDFRQEAEDFGIVAEISGKIIDGEALDEGDRNALVRIFNKDQAGLQSRLTELDKGRLGAKKALLNALLDEHGTGRVVFRNSRRNMKDFPSRRYCPAPLAVEGDMSATLRRLAKEMKAEATNAESEIRYNFKGDSRLDWLVSFLKARKNTKALLICKSKQKVLAIEAALIEVLNVKVGLFHEDLPLVQRDRNAAWFSEEGGAQLLICSEIGSEGRNFQFAHHLILFDLPLNPGLLEQRIGRLDRIGQTETIQIHVPFVVGSCQEIVAQWYHEGLDAFEVCTHGGTEYVQVFGERLLSLALDFGGKSGSCGRVELERFVAETIEFRAKLSEKLHRGRDRLLELNSFDEDVANRVIARIRKADGNLEFQKLLYSILDFFGVRVDEHEGGDVYLDASHAYVEAFPSMPREGMLATFERKRAIAREDIVFVTQDHPVALEAIDLLLNSDKGSTAFCILESDTPNVLLEVVFVLEAVASSKLHVDRFLPPVPVRALVDIRGRDLGDKRSIEWLRNNVEEGSINRFLERPGFSIDFLNAMIHGAEHMAEAAASQIRLKSKRVMKAALSGEIDRLLDLRRINENVSAGEIDLAKAEMAGIADAIDHSRLRLDSLRLVVEGDVSGLGVD